MNSALALEPTGVKGKVVTPSGCSRKAMVWLSLDKDDYQKRLLLMHTEVPAGGKFQFYLKPGKYQLRATDEKGCEFYQKITVGRKVSSVEVRMKK